MPYGPMSTAALSAKKPPQRPARKPLEKTVVTIPERSKPFYSRPDHSGLDILPPASVTPPDTTGLLDNFMFHSPTSTSSGTSPDLSPDAPKKNKYGFEYDDASTQTQRLLGGS